MSRALEGSEERHRELALLKWGLVPRWAKDDDQKKLGSKFVQARAETVQKAPAYRDAFRGRRCLVVIDGFYEWKADPANAKKRLPHYLRLHSGRPFAIAGLWDRTRNAKGEVLETCAVVTTNAEGKIKDLHDRMPLVLAPDAYGAWLSGSAEDAQALLAGGAATQAARAAELDVIPVSTWVNDVRHDDPRCIEPFSADTPGVEPGQVTLPFK
jgi:putative SOS response-associated peptidase YedK